MNPRAVLQRTAGACPAGVRLALWLLPAVAASAPTTALGPVTGPPPPSRPYLAAVGPSPLRFAEAVPPPDLSARPAVGAPPVPDDTVSAEAPDGAPEKPARPDIVPAPAPAPATPPASAAPAAPPRSPPPILADDLRPRVKPEDFLPYFLYPGQGGTVVVPLVPAAAPVPGVLPPSSATYRQQ
jgi:hypothetical protein